MERREVAKRIKYAATAGVVFVSTLITACTGEPKPPMCIGNYPEGKFISKLHSAIDDLDYTSSSISLTKFGDAVIPIFNAAKYPKGREARKLIEEVSSGISDERNIQRELDRILKSIPDETEVTEVDGEDVNDKTFQSQQKILEEVIKEGRAARKICSITASP